MIKKLKSQKNNKGFTLVELIVVIVILAILIGVTIGGIYMYVGRARKNTDINNASAMQKVLSTLATNEELYAYADTLKTTTTVTNGETNFQGSKSIHIEWHDEQELRLKLKIVVKKMQLLMDSAITML